MRLRGRLARDGYAEEVAEEAIARAVRVHAVDDRRYAEALVRMRVAAGKGVEGVLAEIEELGLDPDELEALGEYRAAGEEVDVERALALLDRRPPRAKNKREAAYRKLIQQGFGSSTAATAARRWAESVAGPHPSRRRGDLRALAGLGRPWRARGGGPLLSRAVFRSLVGASG